MREIRSHGYPVETYQFPFIADERAVRSSVLERLTGIVDVRGDREVLLLYTSFNPSLDSALIWVYGPEAQAIAVGSTTGPTSDLHFARLNWEEFSRDLMVANHFSHVIGVYNLDGCVRQGFLARLKNLNWNESVTISAESVQSATKAPGTYPQSLVDRFKSSLFCRSDSNCLSLDNCVVEETSPSPESVGSCHRSTTTRIVGSRPHRKIQVSRHFAARTVEAFRVSIGIQSFRPEGMGPVPRELSANLHLGITSRLSGFQAHNCVR